MDIFGRGHNLPPGEKLSNTTDSEMEQMIELTNKLMIIIMTVFHMFGTVV